MPRRSHILETLNRLAAAEQDFLEREFLAPVTHGLDVRVRLGGVVCRLRVVGRRAEGFAVLRPVSPATAEVVRLATLGERRKYLGLFPAVRLVLCRRRRAAWWAAPAQRDDRFEFSGLVPVRLAEGVDLFDAVVARFDGGVFWFDAADEQVDPRLAVYLREQLARMAAPAALDHAGLGVFQREAYAAEHRARLAAVVEDQRTRDERTLRAALAHAGATMGNFAELGDAYRVSYSVDGRRHTSVVRKGDLTVQSAGICLSGRDRDFDLHSLVGVLREGAAQRSLNPVPWS